MIQAAPGGDVNAAFFLTVWVVAFPGTLGVAVLCVCFMDCVTGGRGGHDHVHVLFVPVLLQMTVLVSAFRSRLSSSALRSPLVSLPAWSFRAATVCHPAQGGSVARSLVSTAEAEVVSVRVASFAPPVCSMHGRADVACSSVFWRCSRQERSRRRRG